MTVTIEWVLGILVGAVAAGTNWLFSLEGRVSRHEASCLERQRNLDERHETLTRALDARDARTEEALDAINKKLDIIMSERRHGR